MSLTPFTPIVADAGMTRFSINILRRNATSISSLIILCLFISRCGVWCSLRCTLPVWNRENCCWKDIQQSKTKSFSRWESKFVYVKTYSFSLSTQKSMMRHKKAGIQQESISSVPLLLGVSSALLLLTSFPKIQDLCIKLVHNFLHHLYLLHLAWHPEWNFLVV